MKKFSSKLNIKKFLSALAIGASLSASAFGQFWDTEGQRTTKNTPAINVIQAVDWNQKLDAQLPLDLPFLDENGAPVKLGDYFKSRPVILVMVYYNCPMLCTTVLDEMTRTLRTLNSYSPGQQFDVLVVSINPNEKPDLARMKKQMYTDQYKRPGTESGWHFLTGNEPEIKKLADTIGFKYIYDKGTNWYYHPAGLTIATQTGRVSRYLFGNEFYAKDVKNALIDASGGKIGTPVEKLLLYCYQYDPRSGKYSFAILKVMQVGGILTMLALGTFIIGASRSPRKNKKASKRKARPDSAQPDDETEQEK